MSGSKERVWTNGQTDGWIKNFVDPITHVFIQYLQASVYEVCDRTLTPLHTPKIIKIKMSLRRVVYCTPQFKRFSKAANTLSN